ncbi:hypothetical protein AB0A77_10705 [Streptomyces varsoviensis]|uniref:hypothetical protein n=1 Tax=Streptomyces varsoviensis TaxID=67373 RepID=UPI0033D45F83
MVWLDRRRHVEQQLTAQALQRHEAAVGSLGLPRSLDSARILHFLEIRKDREYADASTAFRLQEARVFLRVLGFDEEYCNDRSAYAVLALLSLRPEMKWAQASNPILRITEMMAWIEEVYGKRYAANTRESFRRHTLLQFHHVGLVVQNPDRPDRPANSPRWCYQIRPTIHSMLTGRIRQPLFLEAD